MHWKSCKDGIEIVEAVQSATVTNLRGDGYLWKMTRWGIVDTEAEAKRQAEAALNEIKQLRALLEESLAIHRDSLESNKFSDDEPDCDCDACARFRSIIARIEAVLR